MVPEPERLPVPPGGLIFPLHFSKRLLPSEKKKTTRRGERNAPASGASGRALDSVWPCRAKGNEGIPSESDPKHDLSGLHMLPVRPGMALHRQAIEALLR